jgi:exopolyphosphatase/guanosine-5'-triphosphate,3'-diphosphate pyrophosphatase
MIAIFDIGSNSVRMGLVRGQATLKKQLVTTRLGEGLAHFGVLQEEPMRRTVEAMLLLKESAAASGATAFYAYATEAVRKAQNGRDFACLVEQKTGIPVEILSGEEEAEIGVLGALKGACGAIIDIGGASTELAVKTEEGIAAKSLPVGCVVLKNLCGEDDEKLSAFCAPKAAQYGALSTLPLVGIGGTATSLAAFDLSLTAYDPEKVTGHAVTLSALQSVIEKLKGTSVEERVAAGVHPGRADLLYVGAVWMKTVLTAIGAPSFIASDSDNIEGYAQLLARREMI